MRESCGFGPSVLGLSPSVCAHMHVSCVVASACQFQFLAPMCVPPTHITAPAKLFERECEREKKEQWVTPPMFYMHSIKNFQQYCTWQWSYPIILYHKWVLLTAMTLNGNSQYETRLHFMFTYYKLDFIFVFTYYYEIWIWSPASVYLRIFLKCIYVLLFTYFGPRPCQLYLSSNEHGSNVTINGAELCNRYLSCMSIKCAAIWGAFSWKLHKKWCTIIQQILLKCQHKWCTITEKCATFQFKCTTITSDTIGPFNNRSHHNS
jgi:hypothetical protein